MLKWKLISETMLDLPCKFRQITQRTYRMPDQSIHNFEIMQVRPVVCVLALDKQGNLVLVKQFRPGPGQVFTELIAGIVDEGETTLACAQRELLEETGYQGQLEFVTKAYTDGYSSVVRHIFVARDCHKIAEPALDASEFLETVILSPAEFRQHVRRGLSTNTEAAYLALDYLNLL